MDSTSKQKGSAGSPGLSSISEMSTPTRRQALGLLAASGGLFWTACSSTASPEPVQNLGYTQPGQGGPDSPQSGQSGLDASGGSDATRATRDGDGSVGSDGSVNAADSGNGDGDAGYVSPPLNAPFYGVNIHPDYFRTNAVLVSLLQMLKVTHVRCDVYSTTTADTIVGFAPSLAAAGIKLLACITPPFDATKSEDENYQAAKSLTTDIVSRLSPYVDIYECGNELDRRSETYAGVQGDVTGTFKNDGWPPWRGVLRGMIDTIKAMQPAASVGIDFCCADFNAAQMFWDGAQPDGSTGHTPLRWDVSMIHWYRVYGDFDDSPNPYGGAHVNLVKEYKSRFGKPVMFTEWGQIPEATGTDLSGQINDMMTKFKADRANGLVSIFNYQLAHDGEGFGLINNTWDGLTPAGQAFVDFITANPV